MLLIQERSVPLIVNTNLTVSFTFFPNSLYNAHKTRENFAFRSSQRKLPTVSLERDIRPKWCSLYAGGLTTENELITKKIAKRCRRSIVLDTFFHILQVANCKNFMHFQTFFSWQRNVVRTFHRWLEKKDWLIVHSSPQQALCRFQPNRILPLLRNLSTWERFERIIDTRDYLFPSYVNNFLKMLKMLSLVRIKTEVLKYRRFQNRGRVKKGKIVKEDNI